jgi:hypothetical protein
MAAVVTCPCGTVIQIRDEDLSRWLACPRCGVIVYLPPDEAVGAAPAEDADDWGEAPVPVAAKGEAPGEKIEVPDLAGRFRKQEGKARRRYLRRVNRGLAFHYAVPFLFLAGAGTGVLALVLILSARMFDWDAAAEAAAVFFRVSGVLLLLTGLLSALPAVLALHAGGSVGVLAACLGLLGVGCVSAALTVVFPSFYGPAFLGLALAVLFAAWACWMVFLAGLGPVLRRAEVGEGAMRTLWAGGWLLARGLPFLLVGGIAVAAMVKWPVLITVIPASFLGALVTIAYQAGGFDSIPALLLAPTGIPFTLEYLNFIGGLRMLIDRRS